MYSASFENMAEMSQTPCNTKHCNVICQNAIQYIQYWLQFNTKTYYSLTKYSQWVIV